MEIELRAVDVDELWRRFKEDGDERAREQLVVVYSPLVKYLAGRVGAKLPSHVESADLISYGLVGLIESIERFDPGRGTKFRTFAASRIRGAILDELRKLDWVPRSVRTKARQLEKVHATLEAELQRVPTEEEVVVRLGVSLKALRARLTDVANSSILALDDRWSISDSGTDASTLLDSLADSDPDDPLVEIDVDERADRLVSAIAELPARERLVVGLYYYENLRLREVGEVLDLTESRASQIHTKALMGLRSLFEPTGQHARRKSARNRARGQASWGATGRRQTSRRR